MRIEVLSSITVLLLIIQIGGVLGREQKPPHARALCGKQFVLIWKQICISQNQKTIKMDNKKKEVKGRFKL